jgi:hypothetical protein
MQSSLFDPLAWLAARDTLAVRDPDGVVRLRFRRDVRPAVRQEAVAVLEKWGWLLAKQLDVPAGARPRTVRQLVAAGKVAVGEVRKNARGLKK